jgi:hypothetical protein
MTFPITAPASYVPQIAVAFSGLDGASLVSKASPLPTSEPAFTAAAPIVLDTPFAPPRAIAVIAQGAGNVAFRFGDDSTITVPVPAGLSILPFAATRVTATGTTAVATFHALA